MKIEVKQEHIEKGEKENPWACPIARAMNSYDEIYFVEVDTNTVDFSTDDRDYNLPLPKRAQKFVQDFDNGEQVKPFSFNLKI